MHDTQKKHEKHQPLSHVDKGDELVEVERERVDLEHRRLELLERRERDRLGGDDAADGLCFVLWRCVCVGGVRCKEV